jgi:hypothetical protein
MNGIYKTKPEKIYETNKILLFFVALCFVFHKTKIGCKMETLD